MLLKVSSAKREDVFGDRVRINEGYRRDQAGNLIPAGSVCRIAVGKESILAVARGLPAADGAVVRLDDALRGKLRVQSGKEHEFSLRRANWVEEVQWCWSATDPGYRIAARLAVLSVALGAIGLCLGLGSIWLSIK